MNFRKILLGIVAIASLAACQKADPYMTLSEKKFTVGEDGGTINASISANVYYRVNNDMDWANIQIVGTEADATLFEITVDANPKTASRKGRIRFIGDSVTPLYIEITQDAKTPVGVNVTELNVNFNETSASFTVLGNKPWTASSDNDAFVLSATSGTGETDITVSFPENSKFVPVVANITVTIAGENYTLKLTQGAAPSTEKIDLSAAATSNCYIVSKCGYYKFKATVRGNGVVPASQSALSASITPASVKVLWTSFNTNTAPKDNNAVISNVALEDGYVTFQTAELASLVEGNVVIAAYNSDNVIIWSWHVWVTEASNDITVGSTVWMDRNLGALAPSTYMTEDGLAAGLLYQWGRKDPFRGTYTFIEPATGDADIATTATWPEPVLMAEGVGGVDASIKNPMQVWFVESATHNNKDWHWGVQYDDLWGAGALASTKDLTAFPKTTKSMFDPCPVGYCIPSCLQFNTAATDLAVAKTDITKTESGIYGIGKETFFIVYAGGLGYNSGKLTTGTSGPGQYSWYAASGVNGVNTYCARSHTTAFNWGAAASGRSAGYSVRCVKE